MRTNEQRGPRPPLKERLVRADDVQTRLTRLLRARSGQSEGKRLILLTPKPRTRSEL